jgi:hypothetical protein
MDLPKHEEVTHRRQYPEMKTSNSHVLVNFSDRRGVHQQKRIALVGLAALILNCVNQPGKRTPVEEGQDNF